MKKYGLWLSILGAALVIGGGAYYYYNSQVSADESGNANEISTLPKDTTNLKEYGLPLDIKKKSGIENPNAGLFFKVLDLENKPVANAEIYAAYIFDKGVALPKKTSDTGHSAILYFKLTTDSKGSAKILPGDLSTKLKELASPDGNKRYSGEVKYDYSAKIRKEEDGATRRTITVNYRVFFKGAGAPNGFQVGSKEGSFLFPQSGYKNGPSLAEVVYLPFTQPTVSTGTPPLPSAE